MEDEEKEREEQRLILRVLYREDVWMTVDVTNMSWYVLEPMAVDLEKSGCRIKFKRVRFRCSGTLEISDEAWLLQDPVDGEEV